MSGTRDRYIDTIRALAIIRVIVYHALAVGWLTILFPSMGVMFALAGSLMAASITDSGGLKTVGRRLRRLLPPLWVLGAVAVSVMVIHGWTADDATSPTSPRLLFWILPLNTPPSSEWGTLFVATLWYISTYVWFVLLSPALLKLFRRFPVPMLVLPFVLLYVLERHSFGIGDMVLDPINDLCTYLACWLLGFAHHDGMLHRLGWRLVLFVGAAAAAVGGTLTWIGRADNGFDLTTAPLPNAFWSFAFVLILLRARPDMARLARIPWLDRLISLLNARAVTIYLWHNPGIYVAGFLLAQVGLASGEISGPALLVLCTFLWTALATLVFGWIEDIAARRRPSLLPAGARSGSSSGSRSRLRQTEAPHAVA